MIITEDEIILSEELNRLRYVSIYRAHTVAAFIFPAYIYVIQIYVRLNELYRSDSSLCDYSVRVHIL
jgi:hypothetical protein